MHSTLSLIRSLWWTSSVSAASLDDGVTLWQTLAMSEAVLRAASLRLGWAALMAGMTNFWQISSAFFRNSASSSAAAVVAAVVVANAGGGVGDDDPDPEGAPEVT